jgi:hypothetical protein
MSYYDRLQGVLSEQEAPQKGLNQLADAKEYAEDAFSKAVGDANNIASKQMDDFMKIGAKHYAEHAGVKLMKQYVVKPRMDKLAGQQAELDASKQQRIGKLSGEADEITTRGQTRLAETDTEPAYRVNYGGENTNEIVSASRRPTGAGRTGEDYDSGTAMEGKVVARGSEGVNADNVMDAQTGLRASEEGRLSDIVDATKGIAGEEVGGIISKVSKGLDFLGPIGEVAQLGVMAVEGIKNAVEAHKEQTKDISTEQSSIASATQAGEYMGMSRPNFGSMALPSFDTSKSSAMLQQ